jgi:parallel beta-helix repeat protein
MKWLAALVAFLTLASTASAGPVGGDVALSNHLALPPGEGIWFTADNLEYDCRGFRLTVRGAPAFLVQGRQGIAIRNCVLDVSNNMGVRVIGSSGLLLDNLHITGATNGVYFRSSGDATVFDVSVISPTSDGIVLEYEFGAVTVLDSYVRNSPRAGILLHRTGSKTIDGNILEGNQDGVRLLDSGDNRVVNNTILRSTRDGVRMERTMREIVEYNDIQRSRQWGVNCVGYALDGAVRYNDICDTTSPFRFIAGFCLQTVKDVVGGTLRTTCP